MPWWPALVLWPGLCSPVLAIELFEGFQVHGFLSQGYFLTTNNNLFGSSERGGSLDFTEIGVNASWVPRPNLQLAVQFLSRRAGEAAKSEPEFDFGLLDYTAVATEERRLGVRLGRVRLPFGLYNDTRDVAFTRPSILLPQSIYLERTRELAVSGDGTMLYGEERSAWGNLGLEAGAFLARVDDENSELALLGRDFPGDLESRWSFIGRLTYSTPSEALRLAVTGVRLEADYNPRFTFPDDLGPGKDLFEPVIFSAQYNAESWSLTGEYARRPIKDEGFLVPGFDLDIVGESYYVQGIYRIDPYWEMVVRYDVLYNNVDDRDGTEAKAISGIPAHSQFAKDWAFGVRYNITPALMARAEYHNVYGTAWLHRKDNPDRFATDKKWDFFALLVSYRF
ncbi:MAG: hypothetical protein M3436_02905 [Pseudomonadota bacterium]|nr:hypothetical protein [Pseudomonadota bacterium]